MDRKRIPAVGNILFLIHSSFSLILTIMLKKKKKHTHKTRSTCGQGLENAAQSRSFLFDFTRSIKIGNQNLEQKKICLSWT